MPADDYSQLAGFPLMDDVDPVDADNGFADPAVVDLADVADTEEEAPIELTDAEKMAVLEDVVTRHPLNREILYKVLGFCSEERLLHIIEEEIATYPEFKNATQNQYFLINSLVKGFGLELIERNEAGEVVTEADKQGLTEDEIDDLVETFNYKTTDLGLRFVEQHNPTARLIELLNLIPDRKDTYIDVLEFVGGGTRSIKDIEELLKDTEIGTYVNGRYETIKPNVFVDKLERAGALVWDSGWKLTKEGEAYLDEMKGAR